MTYLSFYIMGIATCFVLITINIKNPTSRWTLGNNLLTLLASFFWPLALLVFVGEAIAKWRDDHDK